MAKPKKRSNKPIVEKPTAKKTTPRPIPELWIAILAVVAIVALVALVALALATLYSRKGAVVATDPTTIPIERQVTLKRTAKVRLDSNNALVEIYGFFNSGSTSSMDSNAVSSASDNQLMTSMFDYVKERFRDEVRLDSFRQVIQEAEARARRARADAAHWKARAQAPPPTPAPVPTPPAPTQPETTYTLAVENESRYTIVVTADRVPGCWTLEPGQFKVLRIKGSEPVVFKATYLGRCKKRLGTWTVTVPSELFTDGKTVESSAGRVDVRVYFTWQ